MKYFFKLGIFFLLGLNMGYSNPMNANPVLGSFLGPTAVNDSLSTCQGVSVYIPILNNDIVNHPAISLDSNSVDLGPGHATSFTVTGGTFTYDSSTQLVLFSPAAGFQGTTSINYTVKDNLGNISNQAKITVVVFTAPNSYVVTGGGVYCQGTFGGVGVGLSGSDIGISYQLLINGSPMGSLIPGTGGSIYFGNQTTVGNYRIQAINPVSGCSTIMNSSATVNSVAPPTAYSVSGGGIGCNLGSGAVITLSNSDIGVDYQLQNGSTLIGSPIAGTGSMITFPPVNGSSGVYTVTATNSTTSCTSPMSGFAIVTIYSAPNQYTVSSLNLCEGNVSNTIVLSGSQSGVSYQLLLDGNPVGNPIIGTGTKLNFIGDTVPGVYRIVATNANGCFSIMRNSAVISPSPSIYTLSPKIQNYCPSSPLPSINLSNSDIGVNYQLYSSGTALGSPVSGTGSALVFGPLPAGNYWVIASNSGSGCTSPASDTVSIILNNLPTNYSLTPLVSHYCTGSFGAPLVLSGSQTGVNYQLYFMGKPVGSMISGTGNPLNLGYYPSGKFTISAISVINPCTSVVSDTATIIQDSLPQSFAMTPDTGYYCKNGTGVNINLVGSQTGVSYQLLKNNIPQGTAYPGTGGAINFGFRTNGTYSVIAVNNATGCAIVMANNSVIIADSLPKAFSLLPKDSSYCSGITGIPLVLSGSENGIHYQLMTGNNPVGNPLVGTGSPLNFGTLTQGNYWVLALNPKTSCQSPSLDTAVILKDSLPISYTLNPISSHYCQGDSGIHLSLNGSQTGVQYQVLAQGVPLGSPISGTGSPLDLGLFKFGSYTVLETNSSTHCNQTTNSSNIIQDSTLKKFQLNPLNPHYCLGNGVDLKLSGSQNGAIYQLYKGNNPVGTALTGTGSSLDFGIQPMGSYFIMGNPSIGNCNTIVSDTTTILKDSLPLNFNITGNHEYCNGTGETLLNLMGSEVGVSYQIENLSGAIGSPLAGTGGPLVFSGITSGNYTILAMTPGGCTTTMNMGIPFQVVNVLSGSITSHGASCSKPNSGSLHLSIQGGISPYSILWNTNQTDSVITGLGIGSYSVTIKDSSGCILTLSSTVKNSLPPLSKPVQVSTVYNTPLSFNLSSSISAQDTSINFKTIDLDPGSPGIQNKITLSNMGQFQVDSTGKVTFVPANLFTGIVSIYYTVQDNNGCLSDTSTIQVNVQANSNVNNPLKFPTLFTPNGDGSNDTFGIEGLNAYPNNSIEIFNRWGNQVFYAQGYLKQVSAWTGDGFGEGTYYYILKVEIGGVLKTYSGYVALIRSAK